MKVKRLVSKAEFSTRAGVSRAAVTKACKNSLLAAMSGDKIDLDHEAAKTYLKSRTSKPTVPPTKKAITTKADTGTHALDEENIQKVLDLTIRDVVDQFGTSAQFLDWLNAKKIIEDIRLKQIKTAKEEGVLIPRDLVKTHIFGAIESSNIRLLSDTPKTLTERLHALVKAGGTKQETQKLITEIVGSQLKNVKVTATRILREVGKR
jgi:hypothetical protein